MALELCPYVGCSIEACAANDDLGKCVCGASAPVKLGLSMGVGCPTSLSFLLSPGPTFPAFGSDRGERVASYAIVPLKI